MLIKLKNFIFKHKYKIIICLFMLILIIIIYLYNNNFNEHFSDVNLVKPGNIPITPQNINSENLTNVKPAEFQISINGLTIQTCQVNPNIVNHMDLGPSSSHIAEQELQNLRAQQQPRIDLENQIARQREIYNQNLFKVFVLSLFAALLIIIAIEDFEHNDLSLNDNKCHHKNN